MVFTAGLYSQRAQHSTEETVSKDNKEQVRITLTPAQKELIKNATGKDASALELSAQELEERIAPAKFM
jgi:hypothetical protein